MAKSIAKKSQRSLSFNHSIAISTEFFRASPHIQLQLPSNGIILQKRDVAYARDHIFPISSCASLISILEGMQALRISFMGQWTRLCVVVWLEMEGIGTGMSTNLWSTVNAEGDV